MAKKGVTLVLSGGGAKGMAHVGVIEVLVENKIPIKRIVGTSAGALIGGFYSAGKLGELKKFFTGLTKFDAFRLFFSFPSIHSIFNSKKLDSMLESYTANVKIEKMKIPFTAVAFDILKGERFLFEKGELFDAIRSSISIPGFFKPFKLGEALLVDGGVTDIVPVDVAKDYANKDGDIIVAVNLEYHPIQRIDKFNLLRILDYASYFEMRELARLEEREADVVIHPNVDIGRFSFQRSDEAIRAGRKSARKAIPGIKKLLKKK